MLRILIVDDNAENLYYLDVLLKTNGFIVDQASNGVDALASAHKNIPDLIVTDILMPTMDGFSLCRKWKNDEELKVVPLIFYTATYTDQKDEEFAMSLGAERFVIKPQIPEELLRIISEVIKTKPTKQQTTEIQKSITEEDEYYKGYNEALVRKLEQKVFQLERSNKRLNSFYQVSCDLVSIKSSVDIIQRIIKAIYEIIGYQRVVYFLYDEKTNTLKINEAFGFQKEMYESITEISDSLSGDSYVLAGLAASTRKTINIVDTSKDSRCVMFDPTIKSALFIPVQYEQFLLGVLGLYGTEVDVFSGDEKDIVLLANNLAISIINRQTEEKILQLNLDLEDRILERTIQLQVSNKDLEAFAYSISHDLRAPLRAIEGYSTILLGDYKKQLDAEGIQVLNLICQNTQRMDKFITDLLTLSKVSLRDKKYTKINMSDIAAEVIAKVITPDMRKKITIELSPLPDVFADPILIGQVWDNLILNAIKYSSLKETPLIRIISEVREDENIFIVEDNGIGFNQDVAQNLFQPFQRLYTDDEFQGTGVGLTIVKRIVERHGGRVWAEGIQNQGAKFYFSIPKSTKEQINLEDQPTAN